MKYTKDDIIKFFLKCESGTTIPGCLSGKAYQFIRVEKYIGKGKYARKYSQLNQEDIIVIESKDRKRKFIKLFPEPVSVLCNCNLDEIGYGKLPSSFVILEYADDGPLFPNLLEYVTHYKAISKYLIEITNKT